MNWARLTWRRAGVARSLILRGGQKRAACSAIFHVPYRQLPVFNFLAYHLLQSSAFSSGSANIFNGHAAVMAEGQQAVAKPGPLFQHEQKVESGDLMAGDKNQERTLKALQALYDEPMEKAAAMGLEESASSIENRPIVEYEAKGNMTVPIGSLKLETKDSPMSISTHIDWLTLSEDEFGAHLNELRSSVPGFSPSMLSSQERQNFCSRRHQFLGKCMDRVAELIGDTNLVSVLKEIREEGQCALKASSAFEDHSEEFFNETDAAAASR